MDDPTLIQTSKDIWDDAIDNSNVKKDSFLEIEHDIHYQTVYNLTDYMLTSLFKHGYKSVTVGECLGDPAANWYRAGPGGLVSSLFLFVSLSSARVNDLATVEIWSRYRVTGRHLCFSAPVSQLPIEARGSPTA